MITAILLTLTVGILWSLVGLFYKMIAQYKLSVFNISCVTNLVSLTVMSFLLGRELFRLPEIPVPPAWFVLFMLFAGFINCAGSLMLQRSMVYGRSGVTWAIGQSSLVVPFVVITLIFSEVWSPFRLTGTALVLGGMATLGLRKESGSDSAPRPQYGIVLSLIAFAVLGAAQSMMSASSYLPFADDAGMRPVLLSAGSISAILLGKWLLHDRGWAFSRRAWLIVLGLSLEGVAALYLQFRALDLLKASGMNSIFFPIAIGTCIAVYSVWAVVLFREKLDRRTVGGTLLILAGIAFYCLETSR
ncbi:MAG: DMT family transporter [Lentisphaeria bacterium]|nr:DMT family transporter [Lentisphaeria bacterium]